MSIVSHQDTFLRDGEVLYTQGKFEEAFSAFRKVILLCDCNKALRASSKRLGISSKDIPLPICHCKDYLSLPIDDPDSGFSDKKAIFNMASKPCCCGSGIESCHNLAHIKALTNIANVYLVQKSNRKAVQYAAMAITLAPHVPEGYLRMVTVIRQGGLHCNPDIASRCNWLDTQASHSVRAHGDKNHKMLKPISRRIRRDIIRGVPVEIRQMILRNLPHADICRAMRVSQAWKLACRDRQLWKDLNLTKNWRHTRTRPPLRPGTLNNIVKLSGHMATSLTIDGLWDFKFDGPKLRAMLKALPELRDLSLSGRRGVIRNEETHLYTGNTPGFRDFWAAICENAPSSLTTLHLKCFDLEDNWRLTNAGPVLVTSSLTSSLKELSFIQLSKYDAEMLINTNLGTKVWPNLATLVLKKAGTGRNLGFDLLRIEPCTPALKSLTVDGVQLTNEPDTAKPCWDLERVSLGVGGGSWTPWIRASRSLELNDEGLEAAERIRTFGGAAAAGLEHFRCHFDPYSIEQRHYEDLMSVSNSLFDALGPCIQNGALRSLHLTFTTEVAFAIDMIFKNQKGAIRALSGHNIKMPSIISGHGGNCDEFLDWVATFPSLTTVGAYPYQSENAYLLVFRLLKKRPDIKTIYTNILKGAVRDEALAAAKQIGVTIIHADRVPEPVLEYPPPPWWKDPSEKELSQATEVTH